MRRLVLYCISVAALTALVLWPDGTARSAPSAQAPVPVTMTCSRPVLDMQSGQPVFVGGVPWYAEVGDTLLSHPWFGPPRYEHGGRRYHYIGGVAGPGQMNRLFLVEDCEQPRAAAPATPPPAQVTRLAPDVYVVEHTGYTTIFAVTEAGVIVGDPMGAVRAPLLKAAIEEVTSLPVRYVVYSHHDADHS